MRHRITTLPEFFISLLFIFFLHTTNLLSQELIKEERIVKEFNKIDVSKNISLYISQADSSKVSIETDEHMIHSVIIEVIDGTLKLTTNDRIWNLTNNKVPVTIHVTTPRLNGLYANANSRAHIISNLSTDALELVATSSGEILVDEKLNIDNKLDANSKTKGKITFQNNGSIIATSANLTTASNGEINLVLELNNKIECTAIGNSIITLVGHANEGLLSALSKSELRLKNFKLKKANIVASSSAIIYVNVDESLAATAADRSIINYTGKPKSISKETTTGGKIK